MIQRTAVLAACAGFAAAAIAGPDPVSQTGGKRLPTRAPIGVMVQPGQSGGHTDAFPFTDDFEAHPAGEFPCNFGGCPGPNGWSIWFSGGVPGDISTEQANSGTKSLRLRPLTDIIQEGNATSGQWVAKAMSYFPSAAGGSPRLGYFIIQNTYPASLSQDWSFQLQLNGDTGMVLLDFNVSQTPLIMDQWVEIRVEINLDTDTYDAYYGSFQLADDRAWSSAHAPGGAIAIRSINLFSNGVDGFFYDDVSLEAGGGGGGCYANCDLSTTEPVLNVADFTCFLQRFAAGESYANCDESTTEPVLNVADFTCFLQEFAAGCQ